MAWPCHAMPCHALPCPGALSSGPADSGGHLCWARSASPSALPSWEICCYHSCFGCFRAPYAVPPEFVVRLVPPPGQAALVCLPVTPTDFNASILSLSCPSVDLPFPTERAAGVFQPQPRSCFKPQSPHQSVVSTCAYIRRKLESADKVLDCYKLDVCLGSPEQASNFLSALSSPRPFALALLTVVRPLAMSVLT